jgi:hypothetical protein
MTEAELLDSVRTLARFTGWMTYHTYTSKHSDAGFPDLVLVRGPELIFAELKRERGRITDQQQAWLDQLRDVRAIDVYEWRPGMFETEIVPRLQRRRPA